MPHEPAAENGHSPQPPRRVGKLTVLEKIGSGGMASIYLARADGLGGFEKLVVVKQILPHLAQDTEFIERFFQEARLSATLDHPNIAAVYDVDEADGSFFYSMEYVRGRDLNKVAKRARQRERQFTFAECITIIAGLCAGLHHAHTRRDPSGRALGIIHRDVSPSNVLISYEGAVKLSDFGVAKARTGIVTTATGTLRGKLPYMSPEQCRAEGVDRRSDVYAVGAVLWELLTGLRLHRGDSEIGIIRQIAEGVAPPVTSQRSDCPPALERIVARALARHPAERYQSADAIRVALEEFANEERLAISGRTVSALMDELFAEERDHDAGTSPDLATRVANLPVVEGGQATVTLAPSLAAPSAPAMPLMHVDDHQENIAPARRGLWGVAAGVVFGIALGGGGLYFASAGAKDTDDTGAAARVVEPRAAAGSNRVAVEPEAPSEEPPPTEAGAPAEAKPDAEVDLDPESEPEHRPTRRSKKRPGAKRPRASAEKQTLDLDSPLPPGFPTK